MTLVDVISHWAYNWRNLAAWGAQLPATFKIVPHKGQQRLGRADCLKRTAEILVTGELAEDLATVLHELAHLAVPNYVQHEEPWREMFVAAVAEACGCDASQFDLDVVITDLDAQCRDAIAGWLVRSGQSIVLRSIGVMS
jgi:hypothetical protein